MAESEVDIVEIPDEIEDRVYYASPRQLMWWQFRRSRRAIFATVVLALLYLLALFADVVAPYGKNERLPRMEEASPTKIHLVSDEGGVQRPFVYAVERTVDPETYRIRHIEDRSEKHLIRFFVKSEPHHLWGIFPMNWKLFRTEEVPILLFGADRLGRDLFSRTLYGSRVSLFIGFAGVFLTFLFGITLGGLAGYVGGVVDEVVMRIVDFMVSVPQIPLWMALAAAIPRDWPVTRTYFAITMILSLVGWGGLARVVRGKLLTLREEDYVMAAHVYGASAPRVIFRYMLPNFVSYLLVNVTLSIPATILGETSLSFLGLGMQPPAVSWGVLLKEAQSLASVAQRPWLLIPGAFVVITVLMFNFVGDALRDAADPFTKR